MTSAHITEQQAWPMMLQSCTWSKRMAMDSDSSWEVRAFAEDASSSGQWPPRSYSCSFCQREFRTAQALGGHMNVHRRERAHANQIASLRSAAARLGESKALPLSPDPSPSSTSSASSMIMHSDDVGGTKPLLESMITKFCPQTVGASASISWAPTRGGISYHPYERSSPFRCNPRRVSQGARFSFCLNKVMGDHQHKDALDLELRLGRSSCAV